MASSGLFCDFSDITAQHGPRGLYCHSLAQLYEVCIKEESILHPVTYIDACQRLMRNVTNTLTTLDVKGYPVVEFKFGRSFTTGRAKCKVRPDKPITWNQDKGIASDWREVLKAGYDGVAVLTCINKELVPSYIQDVIKFKSSNGTRQKNQHGIDHRYYAQGLLNALIQHYTFSEPDGRIRNSSFVSDQKDNEAALPEILYMAFKVEKRLEKERSLTTTWSQTTSLHPEVALATGTAVTTETGNECTYRVIFSEQETRKLVKIAKSDIRNIKSKLSAVFNLPRDLSLTYMLYMAEDDEWYECEEDDLPTRGKLKITVDQSKVQASTTAKSSNSKQQQPERKVQSVQPFKQKKATAVVKKAKQNITKKQSSIVTSVKKVTALKKKMVLSKGKSTSKSTSKAILLNKSKSGTKTKSAGLSVVQKTSKRSISPVKNTTKKSDAQNSRKRSLTGQFLSSSSPKAKKIKTEGLSQNPPKVRVSPVSAKSIKKIGVGQHVTEDTEDDEDEEILVKDLEPGTHQKKLRVEVSTMEKSLVNKFRQLDCVFNMHFEDSTGDIYGYVHPGEIYNSLESGQKYEISNFEVWKSPDNVYGLSLDQKAVVRKISRQTFKSPITETQGVSPSLPKSTDSRRPSWMGWSKELDKKVMDIYKEMKRDYDSNNWKYVSQRLSSGHTNEQCRIRVTNLLKNQGSDRSPLPVKKLGAEEPGKMGAQGSSPGSDKDNITWTDSNGVVHRLVMIPKKEVSCQRKKCVYCYIKRHKTMYGCPVETKRKCQQCNKPLCFGPKRDCFTRYHTEICTAENTFENNSPSISKGKVDVTKRKSLGSTSEKLDGLNYSKEKGAESSNRKNSENMSEMSDAQNVNKSNNESMNVSENTVHEKEEMKNVNMPDDDGSNKKNDEGKESRDKSESKDVEKPSETNCETTPEIKNPEMKKSGIDSEKRDEISSKILETESQDQRCETVAEAEMMKNKIDSEKRDEISSEISVNESQVQRRETLNEVEMMKNETVFNPMKENSRNDVYVNVQENAQSDPSSINPGDINMTTERQIYDEQVPVEKMETENGTENITCGESGAAKLGDNRNDVTTSLGSYHGHEIPSISSVEGGVVT